MQPFTFDISTFSPAASTSFGTPGNPRTRARFEDHLGQATHAPQEHSAERAPETSDSKRTPPATRETSESQARERDDAADDERSQAPAQQDPAHRGGEASGQEAAAVAAGGKPTAQEEVSAAGESDDPAKAKVNRRADKQAKLKGKVANGSSPAGGAAPGAGQSTTENANQAALEQVTDTTAVDNQSGQETKGDGSGKGNSLRIDLEADSASNADPSASGVANVVVATNANQASELADGPAMDGPGEVVSIGAEQVESTGKTEPQNAGKRGRNAKAAAIGDAGGPTSEPVAGSRESTSVSATAIEASAPAELLSTVEASAENDPVAADPGLIESNDKAESRASPTTATVAARQERLAGSGERSEGLTETERVRFVQRVARAFHSMSDEGGEVRLRLSPPELGSLRLEVSVRDGMLSARLEAETTSARNVLLDNLPALRERLAEQNIKVERFEVDVRDEQRQAPGEHFAGQPDVPRQGQRERPRGHEIKRPDAIPLNAARGAIRGDNTGQLNIVI